MLPHLILGNLLLIACSAVLLYLAEFAEHDWDDTIDDPEEPITPQDWRRR